MLHKDQKKITNTISNINEECLKADKNAYIKLMERIARVDQYGTVLMMQIENEVGLLGGSRDFSPAATTLFQQNVPTELINHVKQNIDKVKPATRKAYQANGSKTEGSWADVFGESLFTDELFMAWNYATYINQLSKAGKQVHNIPTLGLA